MHYFALVAFIAIIGSLGAALYFMLRGGTDADGAPRPNHMPRALAVRVGLSILLFLCILVGWKLGYLHPTGIPAGK
ncbi:twin transmembrane helix small protein [Pseudorhodoferax sp.]|uniref:twin transmembrane helix small protein n=1 Tax=Pseudorhodoferax sp. TaxID=1993553 RepID=UPI0039E587C5